MIINGTKDMVVYPMESQQFANKHKCKLFLINDADHRYQHKGDLDKVINITFDVISHIKT